MQIHNLHGNILKLYSLVVPEKSRTDFEKFCKKMGLQLFSSAKPTYNGKIERSNRVFREEFYADLSENSIVGARRELMKFLNKYNSYRPHASLHGSTHLEYISKYNSGDNFCLISV